jgi:ABC-type glycerol-3-phosphate transport system substrate-binding protein
MSTDLGPRALERRTAELADSYIAGTMSRRAFVTRLLAIGLAPSVVGAILAACGGAASPSAAPPSTGASGPPSSAPQSSSPSPKDLKGNVRFLIGPWSKNDVEVHNHIADTFKALYPNVTFEFKLFNWTTSATEVNTSLQAGDHDVYYFGEAVYFLRAQQPDGFEDLTSRINDPAWAAEKAKYVYWDRIEAKHQKLIGVPLNWHVEDALFVNMDMVRAAGYDEHFVDTWDTFAACVKKMTKGTETYGLGIGIQLGGFAEWYQIARANGGQYLSDDLKSPAINTPEVVDATTKWAELFKQGIAPPLGTYTYDTAPAAWGAGKMAIYSSDLATTTTIPSPVPFDWLLLPYPPGSKSQVNFNDLGFYAMGSKTPDKDLAWEVIKWWTNSDSDAYWADRSGTYPSRVDAVDHGYGTAGVKQLGTAFPLFQKYSCGPEPFAAWSTIEDQAEAQIQDCYAGKQSAANAVANVEKIVKQEAKV